MKEYIWYYEHIINLIQKNSSLILYPNGTLKIEPLAKPSLSLDELEHRNYNMLVLEQVRP